jgi:hypothetical protein
VAVHEERRAPALDQHVGHAAAGKQHHRRHGRHARFCRRFGSSCRRPSISPCAATVLGTSGRPSATSR